MGRWTDSGFNAYTLGFYKEALQRLFVEAYGPTFKLDDDLPQGVIIQRIAELLYNTDMDAIDVQANLNINTASGIWLDLIGGLRGVPRLLGSPQLATISVTSLPGSGSYTIPSNTEFTSGSEVFVSTSSVIISTSPQTMTVSYSSNGNSSLSVGDTMSCDVVQITNIEVISFTNGQDTESDADYRQRLLTTYTIGNNTMQWVQSKIAESPLVKTTGFGYNDSSSTTDSRPPHTSEWMAVPKAGVDLTTFKQEVGTIIINNKTPSAETYGNTTVTVQDLYGSNKTVKFTIPDKIDLEVKIEIETPYDTGILDVGNVPTQCRDIAAYINSLKIGNDVVMSKVLAFVVGDSGYDVISYKIREVGDDDWVENANFVIGDREYASIDIENITIGA